MLMFTMAGGLDMPRFVCKCKRSGLIRSKQAVLDIFIKLAVGSVLVKIHLIQVYRVLQCRDGTKA